MPVRNASFYSLQSSRRYPLDDRATGTGDGGERLNDAILVDCQLRFPREAGAYAYVGGITITERLVTVLFLAAASPFATSGFAPLAVVSLPQPVERHRHYPVTPMASGAGGFVVFGDVSQPFTARFSTPQQGLLLPRCATFYNHLPVRSLRKAGNTLGLGNIVQIKGGSDINVAATTRVIEGATRDVLLFTLAQQVANRDVQQVYLGPCDQRPESHTCDKDGVETINGLTADCSGNFTIRFVGMTARAYDACEDLPLLAGVTLDQSLGMDDVCLETTAPGHFDGVDACAPVESSSSLSAGEVSLLAMPEFGVQVVELAAEIEAPSGRHLVFSADEPPPVTATLGDFVLETIGDKTACSTNDPGRRNVAILDDGGAPSSLGIRVSTELSLVHSSARANGGLILNYRGPELTRLGVETYFAVTLDRNAGKVRLLRWSGNGFVEEHGAIVHSPIRFDHHYRLSAEVRPAGINRAAVKVTVVGVTEPTWPAVRFSVLLNKYLPADGCVGIGSERALVRFWDLRVEAVYV